MKKIRLATRGSPLAMKQAQMAQAFLSSVFCGAEFEIVAIKTSGDKRVDWSLEKFGGQGLFTKEIEDALLCGDADIAVHSAKDLPTKLADGLSISGVLPREACRDVLAQRADIQLPVLIATGSPRRRAQLKKLFPQTVWSEIRGNVDTRLRKIAGGNADATVLSEAGLVRLGIGAFDNIKFTPLKLDVCVPAVGQGIIALECRTADFEEYSRATDAASRDAFLLERAFLTELGGGCQVAYAANYDGETFRFFHEFCGIQKIKFPPNSDVSEKLRIVGEITQPLK